MHVAAREVAAYFLRLGFTAFGGPAAHIAMMHEETVVRRKWLTEQEFVDLLGITNLIPGPNSTQMAIQIGYRRAGRLGLALAGICFILPAMLMVLGLAWAYTRFGTLPAIHGLLIGMKAVVVAIVLQAVIGLTSTTLRNWMGWFVAVVVLVLALATAISPLPLVFVPGLIFGVASYAKHREAGSIKPVIGSAAITASVILVGFGVGLFFLRNAPYSLPALGFEFLKIGSVLYGSGYVLLAYLNSDLVVRLGWLSRLQVMDAISVGQFTPGPVFTTATFIGYVLGGVPGAVVATVGIFLPSFLLVPVSVRWLEGLKDSRSTKSFLDGVNAASLGLMGSALVGLGRTAIIDGPTAILAVAAFAVLTRARLNSAWLVLVGAVVGFAVYGR